MRYFIYISFFILLCSCKEQSPVPSADPQVVEAIFEFDQSTVYAGEKINIEGEILSDQKNIKLDLLVQHALFSHTYSITASENKFEFEIPASQNQLAGEVLVQLAYQGVVVQQKKYFIRSLEAINKMQNFNGPKDLFADGKDASMNVSIPHDKYENPLMPPAAVNYQASYEGQIQRSEQRPVENLIAYQITPTKLKTGKYLLGSSSSDGFSQEQELIIGAGMPSKFTIELMSFHPFADSRQYSHLKSEVILDKEKNMVADGTLVNFTIKENDRLVGVYQAFTIGGIANVYIENPSEAISWNIQASVHDDIVSNSIALNFSKNVNDFEATWNRKEKSIEIGPVIGVLGQYVPDGTEVKVSNKEYNLEDYIYLEAGVCKYKIAFDWLQKEPSQIELLIGGHEKIIQLD